MRLLTARSFWSLILGTALALSGACSTTPPYVRPAQPLSPEARQGLYQEKSIVYDWWTGYQAGSGIPSGGASGGLSYNSRLGGYMEASGDTISAARARQAEAFSMAGLAVGLGGVLAGSLAYPPTRENLGPFLGVVGAGLAGEIVLLEWGRRRHVDPAVRSFNAFLRRDLGLPEGLTVTVASAPLQVGLYGGFGGAWTVESTYDREDYYQLPGTNNDWPSSHAVEPELDLILGWKFPGHAALEGRFSGQVRDSYGRYRSDGRPAWESSVGAVSVGLMPAYVLPLGRTRGGNPIELMFGCELAWAQLMMAVRRYDVAGQLLGAYWVRTPSVAVVPRIRWLAGISFWKNWGLGIELGYRILRFESLMVTDATGVFAGRSSPDTTLRGTQSGVDFSGPIVSFVLLRGRP